MATGRLARPDEVPRYGSVWTYAHPDLFYFVLGLTKWGWLSSVRIEAGTKPEVGEHLIWRTSDHVLLSWRCIDEGPE